jgi:hypothetical protein
MGVATTGRDELMRRFTTVLSVVALSLGLLASAAFAQDNGGNDDDGLYGNVGPSLGAPVQFGTPNAIIRLSGDGVDAGTTVQICYEQQAGDCEFSNGSAENALGTRSRGYVTSVVADERGAYAFDLRVPADAKPGQHRVVASATSGSSVVKQASTLLTIVDGGATGGVLGAAGAAVTGASGGAAGGATAGAPGVAALVADGESVAYVTPGNSLLALLVVAGLAALLLGPVRRRRLGADR